MDFSTYVTGSVVPDMKMLLARLSDEVEASSISTVRKAELIDALKISGGCNKASRYGLNDRIVFADTELIAAYKYKGDPVEYLNYRFEFKTYPSRRILKDFPLVVAVEASSRCNLRCRMCFQRNMDYSVTKQNNKIMDWEVYEKFLAELDANKLYSIVFASRGEPLLNPNIDKMIKKAKEKGVMDIKLNTNAVLLTEDLSRKLLGSELDLIVFSVDSVVAETYKTIRGTELEKVLSNIDAFLKIKRTEFPDSSIKTRVAMVIANDGINGTQTELDAAGTYWKDRVDELSVKTENDFKEVYNKDDRAIETEACSLLWERVYLWADGTINPCDIDHLSTLSLGNIAKGDTIADIWKGVALNKLRDEHQNGRDRICGVCSNCVGY